MKITIAVGIIVAFVIGTLAADVALPDPGRCQTGKIKGFAVVTGDPRLGGPGAIPSQYTGSVVYFAIRYNCALKGVLVKRVDEGVYDVMFPDAKARVAQVTALTNGASASAYRLDDSSFRVTIRGPVVRNDVLLPKEAGFQITVV